MASKHHVRVTTTPTIEGWRIQEYLGPVVVHRVAGTGFFSDFVASFSDVFGGRSGTYQKQLRSLSEEVIDNLREQASARGGNWLVDLSMDMDEISGKEKEMFMVTAMATAVRAKQGLSGNSESLTDDPAEVSNDVVQAAIRREAVLQSLANNDLNVDDRVWDTITSERMIEPLQKLVELCTPSLLDSELRKNVFPYFATYIERLDLDEAAATLFEMLFGEEQRARAAAAVITECKLRRLSLIRRALQSDDPETRKRALWGFRAQQRTFVQQDVHELQQIVATLKGPAFPKVAKLIPAKGGLFGGAPRWSCPCGAEWTPRQADRCVVCGRDEFGFRPTDNTPADALRVCDRLLAVLGSIFVAGRSLPGGAAEGTPTLTAT